MSFPATQINSDEGIAGWIFSSPSRMFNSIPSTGSNSKYNMDWMLIDVSYNKKNCSFDKSRATFYKYINLQLPFANIWDFYTIANNILKSYYLIRNFILGVFTAKKLGVDGCSPTPCSQISIKYLPCHPTDTIFKL